MRLRIEGGRALKGAVEVPADKSLTHRALIFSALCEGDGVITARAAGEDNRSTGRVLGELGVAIEASDDGFVVHGHGVGGLRPPGRPLDCGNSGTTIRLMTGVLAGAGVEAELGGDASLVRRPMGRVCRPLRELGADVRGTPAGERELPPLRVGRGAFRGGEVALAVASAQVKSALLLAGVASGEAVRVREPSASRDHSERLLRAMGAELEVVRARGGAVTVSLAAGARLAPQHLVIPGDFSSAAFLLAAGALVPGSRVAVRNVGVNPTRTGLLEVLEEYGASVAVSEWREESGEPMATLTAMAGELSARQAGDQPTVVGGATIPVIIDELVVLAALAARADGETLVRDARELRVKESDRVRETVRLLAAFGVVAEERDDGFVVRGPQALTPAQLDVGADHRLALTAAVLALAAPGESTLEGFEVAAVSYPDFVATLAELGASVR